MATTPSRRDLAVTALIFGFFGLAWFGWASAKATRLEGFSFDAGSALAAIVLIIALIASIRLRHVEGAIRNKKARRWYGIIVGVEMILAGGGAAVLGATDRVPYIAAWVAAVVGVHFVALAPLLHDWWLTALAVAMVGAAVWAWWLCAHNGTPTSTTAAPLAGLLLAVYGFLALVRQANLSPNRAPRRARRATATG